MIGVDVAAARRWVGAVACLLVVASCGAYGERGFSGNNPLTSARFVEEVDDMCREVNDDLPDEVWALYPPRELETTDGHDAVRDLQDGIDDLVEDLEAENGPDDLEALRDEYVEVLEEVDALLDEAADAIDDEDPAATVSVLDAGFALLAEIEQRFRLAGFDVCGIPRPVPDEV